MSDFWRSRNVVLTGGAGFLGSVVRRKLEERGAVSITIPRRADHDLMQRDQVAKLFAEADPDMVIHLAARVGGIGANMERPAELYLANLLMGTNIIEESRIRGVDKTVLVGTICSYPKYTPVPFKEDDLWNGYPEETNAPYGIAKKAVLVHARSNRAQYGQRFAYVLPTNLYGPGDKFNSSVSHVIPALIKKFVEAKDSGASTVEIWGSGNATREFLYVEDAAEGILLAAEKVAEPDPINLGTGAEIKIADLARMISKLVGFEGDLVFDTSKPDGQPRRAVDASRARAVLGFEALTPLEAGLRTTIDWYVTHREEAEAATL